MRCPKMSSFGDISFFKIKKSCEDFFTALFTPI